MADSAGAGRLTVTLEIASTAATLLLCIVVAWSVATDKRPGSQAASGTPASRKPSLPLPAKPVAIGNAPVAGDVTSARVAVMEFSDYQCPYCRRFHKDTLPAFRRAYVDTGRVLLVFRHLPLETLHPLALGSAIATICAGEQHKFWEMHDLLFKDPARLTPADISMDASALALDTGRFHACVTQAPRPGLVAGDLEAARSLGVSGTPSFLIGTVGADRHIEGRQWLVGAVQFAQLKAAIDPLLDRRATTER